jgi:hypothetical protein
MSIGNIKNLWLRRTVLILTAPILVPLTVLLISAEAVAESWDEIVGCFKRAWRK